MPQIWLLIPTFDHGLVGIWDRAGAGTPYLFEFVKQGKYTA